MSSLPYICELVHNARNTSSERREQNNEKLINEIYNRRGLWDQESHDYGNRSLKVQQWEAIASEMNQSVAEVKGRWKHLKDSFNREIRNMARSGNNSTKWAHFQQMSFLLRGINSLLLPRFNPVAESDSGYLSHSLFDADLETQNTASSGCENELSDSYIISKEEQSTSTPTRKRLKTNHISTASDIPTVVAEPNSLVNLNENNPNRSDSNSEDYYFLMSLLPTFERLSPQKKMLVKIKLMQNIYEAAFGEENSDLSHNREEIME